MTSADAGPVTVPSASEHWSFKVDEGSAQMLRGALEGTGALVCGRRLFDIAEGWGTAIRWALPWSW